MITVDGVSKRFGKTAALSNVSLDIRPGERLALIGASGSGKSTLIRTLAGLVVADGGGCIKFGDDVLQSNGAVSASSRRIRSQIGIVFQQFNLVRRSSVLKNVLIGRLGHVPVWRGTLGLFTRDEKRRAMLALAEVGIAEQAQKRASDLSGGQQQWVAIARCLVQETKVILADEPIASLDPKSAKRVMDTLTELNSRYGMTVVVSLHQIDYATAYFPRVVALRDGLVVYDGPSSKLTKDFLTELYGAAADELISIGSVEP